MVDMRVVLPLIQLTLCDTERQIAPSSLTTATTTPRGDHGDRADAADDDSSDDDDERTELDVVAAAAHRRASSLESGGDGGDGAAAVAVSSLAADTTTALVAPPPTTVSGGAAGATTLARSVAQLSIDSIVFEASNDVAHTYGSHFLTMKRHCLSP